MKTFKEYLAETTYQKMTDFVGEHCAPWLKDLNGDEDLRVWRGLEIKSTDKKVLMTMEDGKLANCYIKTVRTDRKPLDTHPELSNAVDDLLYEKFGWHPRKNGLFVYGPDAKGDTKAYGTLHQVFPIGDIEFCWSPEIADMFGKIGSVAYKVAKMNGNDAARQKDDVHTTEELEDFKNEMTKDYLGTYTDDNLRKAISSGNEIMVKCKSYLAVPRYWSSTTDGSDA